MGIQDEIFKIFIKKLSDDAEFPATIVEELSRLIKEGKNWSENDINRLILEKSSHDDKDKND